jgi:hypothetical protein
MKNIKLRWVQGQVMECDIILKDDMTEDSIINAVYMEDKVTLEDGCEVVLSDYIMDNGLLYGVDGIINVELVEENNQ